MWLGKRACGLFAAIKKPAAVEAKTKRKRRFISFVLLGH